MKTISFNTGRWYARTGQPIVAAYDEQEQVLYFKDCARGIDGIYTDVEPHTFNQRGIMTLYDAGGYDWPGLQHRYLISAVDDVPLKLMDVEAAISTQRGN